MQHLLFSKWLAIGGGLLIAVGAAAAGSTEPVEPAQSAPRRSTILKTSEFRLLDDAPALADARGQILREADRLGLQQSVDEINRLWHTTLSRKHALIERIALDRIARGEVAPSTDRRVVPDPAILGTRAVVVDGIPYVVAFHSGEELDLDRIELELQQVRVLATDIVNAWFE